jgi:transcriptional regulator with XRE-family HTH domain
MVAYRKKNGLTQPQLAKKLGVTNGYISLLETGERLASWKMALKIERVTGIPRAAIRPDIWRVEQLLKAAP